MKKYIVSAAILCSMSTIAFSQGKAVKDTILNLPTVQCEMAKSQVETYLRRVDGITFVNLTPKKKQIRVKYITDRTNVEAIKAHIANAGYNAEDVTANPDSYQLLPACCKKPALKK